MRTMSLLRSSWLTPLVCGLFLAAVSSGCGRGNSPTRYRVVGSVTFAGKPVPAGAILFTPNSVIDKGGVAGCATIKDGKYDTSVGDKGISGGPQIVRISGFDGVPSGDSWPNGKPLFPEYVIKVDLPKEKTTHDFDVPAAHAEP